MAGEEGSTLGIIKFDDSNYSYWWMQMQDFLFNKKMHLSLGSKREEMKVKDWNLLVKQVLRVIRLTLSKNETGQCLTIVFSLIV